MDIWNEWMCRICQAECLENFECVFVKEATQLELSSLGILYEELFNLSIHRQPDQPQSLCRSCTDRLKEFYEFKTKAVESYEKFCKIYIKEIGDETTAPSDEQCTQDVSPEIKIEYEEQNDEEQIIKNSDMSVIDPLASIDMPSAGPKEEQIEVDREFVDADCLEDVEDDAEDESSEEEDQEATQTTKRKDTNSFHMIQCKNCKQFLDTKRHLVKHRSIYHKGQTYTCEQCPKKFRLKEMLEVHLKTHQGLPAYECEPCKKSFNKKYQYVNHMNGHRNVRTAQCHLCGKGFLTQGDLKIHFRSHTDERRYECDICGRKFLAHSHMVNHRFSHLGKTIECEYCQQKYTTPTTLKTHIRSVHKNICPYSCKVCNKQFKRRHHVKAHMKTH